MFESDPYAILEKASKGEGKGAVKENISRILKEMTDITFICLVAKDAGKEIRSWQTISAKFPKKNLHFWGDRKVPYRLPAMPIPFLRLIFDELIGAT